MSGFDALMTGLAYSRGREADDAWGVARHNAAMVDEWADYARGLERQIADLNRQVEHLKYEFATANESAIAWRERSATNAGGARAMKQLISEKTGQTPEELAGGEEAFEELAKRHADDVREIYQQF